MVLGKLGDYAGKIGGYAAKAKERVVGKDPNKENFEAYKKGQKVFGEIMDYALKKTAKELSKEYGESAEKIYSELRKVAKEKVKPVVGISSPFPIDYTSNAEKIKVSLVKLGKADPQSYKSIGDDISDFIKIEYKLKRQSGEGSTGSTGVSPPEKGKPSNYSAGGYNNKEMLNKDMQITTRPGTSSGTQTYTPKPQQPAEKTDNTPPARDKELDQMTIGGVTVTKEQVEEYDSKLENEKRRYQEKLDELNAVVENIVDQMLEDVDLGPQDEAEEEIYDAWRAIEEARADVPEESGYSSRKRGGRKVQEQHATVFATSLAVLGGVTGTMLIANAVSQTGPAGHATATAITMAPQLALFLIVGGLAGLAAGALHLSKQENR